MQTIIGYSNKLIIDIYEPNVKVILNISENIDVNLGLNKIL